MKYIILLLSLVFAMSLQAQFLEFNYIGDLMNGEGGKIYYLVEKADFEALVTRVEILEKDAKPIPDEKEWLIAHATSAKYVADTYNKSNRKKRGYSTEDIAYMFDVSVQGSETMIAQRIYDAIVAIQNGRNWNPD